MRPIFLCSDLVGLFATIQGARQSLKEQGRKQKMAKYVKGQSGNPAGRPVGSRNYTNVALWLEMIYDRIPKMDFDQQVTAIWRAVDALMPKVPSLPATQADSAQNAAKIADMMNGLAPQVPPLESHPSANGGPSTNGANGAI